MMNHHFFFITPKGSLVHFLLLQWPRSWIVFRMGGSRVTDEICAINAQLLRNQLADAILGRSSQHVWANEQRTTVNKFGQFLHLTERICP